MDGVILAHQGSGVDKNEAQHKRCGSVRSRCRRRFRSSGTPQELIKATPLRRGQCMKRDTLYSEEGVEVKHADRTIRHASYSAIHAPQTQYRRSETSQPRARNTCFVDTLPPSITTPYKEESDDRCLHQKCRPCRVQARRLHTHQLPGRPSGPRNRPHMWHRRDRC